MEAEIGLFISRFLALKKAVDNAPSKLSWLGAERQDLQELCHKLDSIYRSMAKTLATKDSKHTFIEVVFEDYWLEYERNYRSFVEAAGKPAAKRERDQLEQWIRAGEEKWTSDGKTKEEYYEWLYNDIKSQVTIGNSFDPLKDNPSALVADSRNLIIEILMDDRMKNLILPEDVYGDHYDKVVGAWDFYEKTIGLDLAAVHKRWSDAPELFIQAHVVQTDNAPLVELYNEAVRAFVFGAKIAAVAMCRALMEHILKKHYGIQENGLAKVIATAEARHPQCKKWRLGNKKKMGDDVLHNYETFGGVDDKDVIDFLKTIKLLVRDVPK